jgi:hypothetical protein
MIPDYIEYLRDICNNKWTSIHDNLYIFKKSDGGISVIYPDVISWGVVQTWQSLCYRLTNNIRIHGITWAGSNILSLKRKLNKELKFLSSIDVPERLK